VPVGACGIVPNPKCGKLVPAARPLVRWWVLSRQLRAPVHWLLRLCCWRVHAAAAAAGHAAVSKEDVPSFTGAEQQWLTQGAGGGCCWRGLRARTECAASRQMCCAWRLCDVLYHKQWD
jgi:hypothetical protein